MYMNMLSSGPRVASHDWTAATSGSICSGVNASYVRAHAMRERIRA